MTYPDEWRSIEILPAFVDADKGKLAPATLVHANSMASVVSRCDSDSFRIEVYQGHTHGGVLYSGGIHKPSIGQMPDKTLFDNFRVPNCTLIIHELGQMHKPSIEEDTGTGARFD